MSQKKEEYEFYKRGAEEFGFNIEELEDKYKYKQEYGLNNGIWYFRDKMRIIFVTRCISSNDYIHNLVNEKMIGFDVYYLNSDIPEEKLFNYNGKIMYKRINKNIDSLLGKYSTIVIVNNDTTIYDMKNFGLKEYKGSRVVYRIKDKEIFNEKMELLRDILK